MLLSEQHTYTAAVEFLAKVPLLVGTRDADRAEIAAKLQLCEFQPNQTIVAEGERADAMYIMESGHAVVTINGNQVHGYERGMHFGEKGLIMQKPRAATVKASGTAKCMCWKLSRGAFDLAMQSCGPELLERVKKFSMVRASPLANNAV